MSGALWDYGGRTFTDGRAGGSSWWGVTGTNGKTTVAYLVESILSAAGLKPGVIGTIKLSLPGTPSSVAPYDTGIA